MRRARRVLLVVLILLVVAGVLALMARAYLHSSYAAAQVAARLEAVYGGPVRVAEADIGFHGSTLRGVQLFEAADAPAEVPWAVVEEATADVTAWAILGGAATPRDLTLTRAALTLRFDRDGHLLTRLPARTSTAGSLPTIRIQEGRVTIQQEGRPDLVVSGIEATLKPEGDGLGLDGTANDPHWGEWTLAGNLNPETGAASGTLRTAHIHLTQQELQDLPFVPPRVWYHVQVEGDTPVELTLAYDPAAPGVHYRVALEPEKAQVHVTAIDLHADQAWGKVVIEDGTVHLVGVQGKTAEGMVQTDAVMNFRATPTRLQFGLTAQGLALQHLPKKWALPPVAGRLTGKADLLVLVHDGKAHPSGQGKGEVTPRLLGFNTRPIGLSLQADEDGFHFSLQRRSPASAATQLPGASTRWNPR